MWKNRLKISLMLAIFAVLAACYATGSREKEYLSLIRSETELLRRYEEKGYLSYLAEQNESLPKRIDKKNKCIAAMNTAYAELEQSEKTRYVETWRPEFSKVWQEYVAVYARLKSASSLQTEEQKFELQRLEKLWQATMDAQTILSPDAPLFSVNGD